MGIFDEIVGDRSWVLSANKFLLPVLESGHIIFLKSPGRGRSKSLPSNMISLCNHMISYCVIRKYIYIYYIHTYERSGLRNNSPELPCHRIARSSTHHDFLVATRSVSFAGQVREGVTSSGLDRGPPGEKTYGTCNGYLFE